MLKDTGAGTGSTTDYLSVVDVVLLEGFAKSESFVYVDALVQPGEVHSDPVEEHDFAAVRHCSLVITLYWTHASFFCSSSCTCTCTWSACSVPSVISSESRRRSREGAEEE